MNKVCKCCGKSFKWWQTPVEMTFFSDLYHRKCFVKEEREAKKLLTSKKG